MNASPAAVPFGTDFTTSPTFVDFSVPSAVELFAKMHTAPKGTTAEEKAARLNLLGYRTLALAQCDGLPEDRQQEVYQLPPFDQTFQLAARLDHGNGRARVVLLQIAGEDITQAVELELRRDPAYVTGILHLLGRAMAVEGTGPVSLLSIPAAINGDTRTVAEWLAHVATIDEYSLELWSMAADVLRTEAVRQGQLQTAFGDDDDAEAAGVPEPTVSIAGRSWTAAACAARVVDVWSLVIAHFGPTAVSGRRVMRERYPYDAAVAEHSAALRDLAALLPFDGSAALRLVHPPPTAAEGATMPATPPLTQCVTAPSSRLRHTVTGDVAVLSKAELLTAAIWGGSGDPELWRRVIDFIRETSGLGAAARPLSTVRCCGEPVTVVSAAERLVLLSPCEAESWGALSAALLDTSTDSVTVFGAVVTAPVAAAIAESPPCDDDSVTERVAMAAHVPDAPRTVALSHHGVAVAVVVIAGLIAVMAVKAARDRRK